MDDWTVNQWVGALALGFGLFVAGLYLRMARTGQRSALLGKLEPMQARFGRTPGALLHATAYCALPILFGLLLLTR